MKLQSTHSNTSDSTYKNETYISHLSKLTKEGKSYQFINMKQEGGYYLHRIEITGDTFVLSEITDNIDEKFSNSEDLKAFVEDYMHLSFFYNNGDTVFRRLE